MKPPTRLTWFCMFVASIIMALANLACAVWSFNRNNMFMAAVNATLMLVMLDNSIGAWLWFKELKK
jgi:Ca2+/Na+ antiporter